MKDLSLPSDEKLCCAGTPPVLEIFRCAQSVDILKEEQGYGSEL